MAIPTTIESLSTTAASNGPAGSEDRSTADDGLRQAYAFIKQGVSLGSNIASASSITPPSTGSVFNITGTTTITAIASTNSWDGRIVTFIFAGALTLTHSSSLALPGSANMTTAANDVATFVQTASGAWRLTNYAVAAADYLRLSGGTLTGSLTGPSFIPNSSTLPTNGLYLNAANTPGLVSNGVARWVVEGAGKHTFVASTSGSTVTIDGGPSGATFVQGTTSATCGSGWLYGAGAFFWIGTTAVGRFSLGGTGVTAPANGAIDISNTGNVTINAPSSGYALNIPLATPASAAAAGTQGDIACDANYVYVCTATNTWKRAALTTW